MKILTLFLVTLPLAALAEAPAPYPETIDPADIISAVGPSWNAGGRYKAVLLRQGEYAALAIFSGPFDKTPAAYAPEIALTGTSWGNVPWLEFNESGALLLYNQNVAYGNNKWQQVLTIIERNGRYIVSRFSLNAYDTRDENNNTECELDIIAGTMVVNGGPVTATSLRREIGIADWSEQMEETCYQ